VLRVRGEHKLIDGTTVGVDSTVLEANAAMKSIVRKETGEDWKKYVKRLAAEERVEIENDEDLRKNDKNRENKTASNDEWKSKTDPDSRIMKMKDKRTHLAYKAEHTIDLDTELILAAEVYHANEADSDTIGPSISAAQDNLIAAESDANIEEAVADKGYYKNETLSELEFTEGLRTYIAEPKFKDRRNWKNKPEEQRQAVTNNRRRTKGKRGRALQRKRSERVERSFAHVCGTGGSRRTWLWGIEKVHKRYLMSAMSRNLGLVMRSLFGFGTARSLQAEGGLADNLHFAWFDMQSVLKCLIAKINRADQKSIEEPTASFALALAA